jgi:hypothetical protein
MLVIPVIWEAEIGGWRFKLTQAKIMKPYSKNN